MNHNTTLPDEAASMKAETFKADGARQIIAHRFISTGAADLMNPLIGQSAGETFSKIDPIMELLYELLDRDLVSEDTSRGVKLVVQTVWSAVQYERDVAKMEGGEA